MLFDTVTIIVSAILLLLAVTSSWLANAFWRRPKGDDIIEPKTLPCFSIVIPVHDNAAELKRNLDLILSQNYEQNFEVIVVDESSTDDTEDVLKLLKNRYPQLYVTFIPKSSHYLSRRKLSLTVGVKAAKYEWLIFTTADCYPKTAQWLKAIAKHCNDGIDMVLGYTPYSRNAKVFHRFYRMLTACYCLYFAERGMAYACVGCNITLRKSVFMEHNGFLANLKYLRGEYDFIVNEYAKPKRIAIAIEEDAQTVQDAPSRKTRLNDNLFYMETRKHLAHSFMYRAVNNIDTALLHINLVVQVVALVCSIVLHNLAIITASSLAIVITLTLRLVFASKAIHCFGEIMPVWLVPFMELWVMWQRVLLKIRYQLSDKYDFIRK